MADNDLYQASDQKHNEHRPQQTTGHEVFEKAYGHRDSASVRAQSILHTDSRLPAEFLSLCIAKGGPMWAAIQVLE
ncbi:MAG: hypothetical protein Marn2KO_11740 [Marinobacter nauticus]